MKTRNLFLTALLAIGGSTAAFAQTTTTPRDTTATRMGTMPSTTTPSGTIDATPSTTTTTTSETTTVPEQRSKSKTVTPAGKEKTKTKPIR